MKETLPNIFDRQTTGLNTFLPDRLPCPDKRSGSVPLYKSMKITIAINYCVFDCYKGLSDNLYYVNQDTFLKEKINDNNTYIHTISSIIKAILCLMLVYVTLITPWSPYLARGTGLRPKNSKLRIVEKYQNLPLVPSHLANIDGLKSLKSTIYVCYCPWIHGYYLDSV